ncbi:MAG: hypothetical protein KF830_02025 [Planctomycetes bacterium]|nr:hypothetical protein [Planctomycetota bacterium]
MPTSNPPHPGPRWLLPTLAAAVIALAGVGIGAWQLKTEVEALHREATAQAATLREVLGEVTRIRLEQRAEALGPAGLLAKLRAYAPLVTSARVPEPDYQQARRELDAILRAFEAIGPDAWKPVLDRLGQLRGDSDYDEARYLIRAALRIDPRAGKEIAKDVLAGVRLPSPRLRWDAARILLEADRQLAQRLLRHILTTESSRGVNPERMGDPGLPIPDPAALSATGFHNFVALYVQSEDPALEDTLLMLLGRAEHDLVTVQECVKALGERRCERAVPAIEALFRAPPHRVENPLFQVHCLTALHQIQGAAARPFLEAALRAATSDTVANHCRLLLGQVGG